MNEQTSNRTNSRRKAKQRKLITIIVLLLLCVAASLYILTHFGRAQENVAEEPQTETPAAEEPAEEEAPQTADTEAAASHVYSHRGEAGDDELTFAAYDRAVEAGSKYLEADLVVSASGTVYLAHDDYALDMTGTGGYFSGMTDGQIDKLQTKSGSKVLKLKDLFEKYGDSVNYILDIKYTSQRNIEAFTIAVRTYGLEDNIIAASSYFDALRPLDETFPDMTKIYICADQATFDLALDHEYVDMISVPKEIMTADNLKAAHDHDKKFSAWTLNSEEEIREAIDLGVDSYFTDDTALAIKTEQEYRTE